MGGKRSGREEGERKGKYMNKFIGIVSLAIIIRDC